MLKCCKMISSSAEFTTRKRTVKSHRLKDVRSLTANNFKEELQINSVGGAAAFLSSHLPLRHWN